MIDPILVVEDDEPVRCLVETVLRDEGLEVHTAESAEEALEMSGRWSLLITDLKMPGASGLSLATSLREADRSLPVILMTGHPDRHTFSEAERLGVRRCISKPFSVDDLVGEVHSALRVRPDAAA